MEKNLGFTNVQPSAPLPTAPPSYEEAIANTGGAPTHPPVMPTPYPPGNAPIQMPMPYNQPPNQTTMPMPSVYPGSSRSTSQPCFNAESNSVPRTQLRVIQQHVVLALGPNAVKMCCPTCHADIKTTTISDHQPSAHICCVILCLLGCCLCSCLPYCMNAFMSVHHFCPNCKNYIGTWKG
ncbi:PREDICTED: lipopolysaccharide-induced tumor necrosis factor-alpha factor homolog [Trachymyrmex cornetzi]|uniref:Lipopolysaccharide-induced tumor necrosis factor-alpha factor like protein n=1 Tax=Trachymyrmex cornetzi TaxID=471704 RepID=A0A195DZ97_9HYME|nr:PREDICTED: lipopolysaccharide-induced tumor necrosis factor-alpha factor homolog [Trachymyrmex cornetzi]XP_018365513.1 PREDICTED: lipopolysaccharide-induced tumor necrosis factor-alpha factor homolog [Trachymyrmex cornetzi]KYN18042.1 Lipopolysaccharide-induced tumor necrosis factor-alpha factor like protein [Trachymyrmex cornetzi]